MKEKQALSTILMLGGFRVRRFGGSPSGTAENQRKLEAPRKDGWTKEKKIRLQTSVVRGRDEKQNLFRREGEEDPDTDVATGGRRGPISRAYNEEGKIIALFSVHAKGCGVD